MTRNLKRLSVAAIVSLLCLANMVTADESRRLPQTGPSQVSPQTATVTVTIIKINAEAQTVSVRDQTQKVWDFVVDPKYGIDLSLYKVGDTVTATIVTAPATTNPEARASISKSQLIKLQKKS